MFFSSPVSEVAQTKKVDFFSFHFCFLLLSFLSILEYLPGIILVLLLTGRSKQAPASPGRSLINGFRKGEKMADVIRFPNKHIEQNPSSRQEKKIILTPSMEMDMELDRALAEFKESEGLREDMLYGSSSHAFSNALRLLRLKPEELPVFCNTILEGIQESAPWGDVFGLTDPPDTYRYLFTLYSKSYLDECRRSRGDTIAPSSENIILSSPCLGCADVVRGVIKWINRYYPGLKGVAVRLEDPIMAQEMISSTFLEE